MGSPIYKCPVCDSDLNFQPWNGNSASDEICPTCKIQFGYDDVILGEKDVVYRKWRDAWINNDRKGLSNEQIQKIHNEF